MTTANQNGPTVTGPDFVALMVRDLDRAAGFYTERLGLRPAPQSPPDAVVFATSPIPFAVRRPAPGVDLDAGAPGTGVALWLRCTDADSLHEHLAAAGVPVLQPPIDSPFGRTFVVRDPDGYAVTLHDGN